MPQGSWASLVEQPHTCPLSTKRRRDVIMLKHELLWNPVHSKRSYRPWTISASVSLLRTTPSTLLFSLSFIHHECTPPKTSKTAGGVLLFIISMIFALVTMVNPLTSGIVGATGAAALCTGFVTAAPTDLKSSGTSDTASPTARGISPLEARESTTLFTGVLVCGLKICFLRSGVVGGCGFETGGGTGVGATANCQGTRWPDDNKV